MRVPTWLTQSCSDVRLRISVQALGHVPVVLPISESMESMCSELLAKQKILYVDLGRRPQTKRRVEVQLQDNGVKIWNLDSGQTTSVPLNHLKAVGSLKLGKEKILWFQIRDPSSRQLQLHAYVMKSKVSTVLKEFGKVFDRAVQVKGTTSMNDLNHNPHEPDRRVTIDYSTGISDGYDAPLDLASSHYHYSSLISFEYLSFP